MKNKNCIKKIFVTLGLVVASVLGVSTGNVSAQEASWGPQDRATFTWDEPADYVTFNSITNNPSIGDERNFVRVKEVGTSGAHLDNVTIEAGKEYEVYIYYHNNASESLNTVENGGRGISTLTQLSTTFPDKVSGGHAAVVKGSIFSKEGSPTTVWDTAYLNANETLYLSYVANSAVVHSGGSIDGTILDGASLLDESRGAKIGYFKDQPGVLPGCNEYAGYVTYRIKVDKPSFTINKTASGNQSNDYGETINVAPGSIVDFKILYKNDGTTDQLKIVAFDKLPAGMKYLMGTTFVKTPTHPEGAFVEDKLFDGGLGLGDFHAGEMAEITYKVQIEDDENLFPCGATKIYNNSSIATQNGTGFDKVEVTVTRNCGGKEPEGGCINEDGTVKDTYECKCYNEDGSVKDIPECKNATVPSELPSTGPTEIVLTVIVLTGAWVMGAYWYASHRELNKIKKNL